jgi:hypothetical protein
MSYPWLIDPKDGASVDELRDRVSNDAASVLIFLGAGLSFGVGRYLGRATFEVERAWDDGDRFPSWPGLIDRMKEDLVASASKKVALSYERFFANNDYLDCAQLYKSSVDAKRYRAFLKAQFKTLSADAARLTPSHRALVDLPISEVFTTNYDELIELAYKTSGVDLQVSATKAEFVANQPARPPKHLIKLHGTIARPDTIVLTRDDYAASRQDRADMFQHLAHEVRYTSFLFVGFSLSDPNFNLVRDDARLAMGEHMPASYLVQQRPDEVVRRYLDSLDVRTIGLENWNALPAFMTTLLPA